MRRLIKIVVWFILVVAALVIIIGGGIYLFSPHRYNILIIGSDQRDPLKPGDVSVAVGRSDVLMVVSIPKNKSDQLTVLMIPRDTKIQDSELGLQKINHLYALGGRENSEVLGSLTATKRGVENLLDEKMDASFEVTFQGFEDLVNLLGGVDTTTYGHLNAVDAVEVVHNRYDKEGGDFGRAAAQREILRNLITRAKKYDNAKAVLDYLKTSEQARLSYSKFKTYCFGLAFILGHLPNLGLGEMQELEVPGEGGRIYTPDFGKELYYWLPDTEALKVMVKENIK